MNYRRQNVTKNLKDYIVPIIGLFLILVLIISIFSGDDASTKDVKNQQENLVGFNLTLDGDDTQATIVYPGEYKTNIEGPITVYKGEKILVKQGGVSLSLNGVADLKLSKLGELKYTENGNLYLYSSDLWLNSDSQIKVDMKYANVSVGPNSTLSFSQNEMGSTIYLLSGFAEVKNLVGESTVLAAGQKISISRLEASKNDLDLQLAKESIDDYFQSTDWFIKNNGAFYLASNAFEKTSSGEVDEVTEVSNGFTGIIGFDSLVDESQVSDPKIDITGTYEDENISVITINGINAVLNTNLKTFKFTDIGTGNKENDLVIKVVDNAGDVLEKFVYTVYYAGGSTASIGTANKFEVKNFAVDAAQFQFTSPTTTNTYATSEDFITIRGSVTNKNIAYVTVNGYKLNSYNGSTWRYHASTPNDNLKDGTNIYEVKYFDENNNIVFTNYYTINKKLPTKEVKESPEVGNKESATYSDEA